MQEDVIIFKWTRYKTLHVRVYYVVSLHAFSSGAMKLTYIIVKFVGDIIFLKKVTFGMSLT